MCACVKTIHRAPSAPINQLTPILSCALPPKTIRRQYTKFHGVSLTLLRKFAKQILKALAFLAHKDVRMSCIAQILMRCR